MNKDKQLNYTSPFIKIIEVDVEKGFATSALPGYDPDGTVPDMGWGN